SRKDPHALHPGLLVAKSASSTPEGSAKSCSGSPGATSITRITGSERNKILGEPPPPTDSGTPAATSSKVFQDAEVDRPLDRTLQSGFGNIAASAPVDSEANTTILGDAPASAPGSLSTTLLDRALDIEFNTLPERLPHSGPQGPAGKSPNRSPPPPDIDVHPSADGSAQASYWNEASDTASPNKAPSPQIITSMGGSPHTGSTKSDVSPYNRSPDSALSSPRPSWWSLNVQSNDAGTGEPGGLFKRERAEHKLGVVKATTASGRKRDPPRKCVLSDIGSPDNSSVSRLRGFGQSLRAPKPQMASTPGKQHPASSASYGTSLDDTRLSKVSRSTVCTAILVSSTAFGTLLYLLVLLFPDDHTRAHREQEVAFFVQHLGNSCVTTECEKAVTEIRSSIDKSVDPCRDFYGFSCGLWGRENPYASYMTAQRVAYVNAVNSTLWNAGKLGVQARNGMTLRMSVVYRCERFRKG
ncbi:hypothetical protein MTO96_044572, partial [Rhipicephalus appendiculatus]